MRLLWPRGCPFLLNGEVDKRAHPILMRLGADGHIPDLLVHTPGDMAGNHAVVEVKPARGVYSGLEKDLTTLSIFRERVGYARGIYLVYGEEVDDKMINRIGLQAAKCGMETSIELWVHSAPNVMAQLVQDIRLSPNNRESRSAKA